MEHVNSAATQASRKKPAGPAALVQRVFTALLQRRLTREDLSARKLSAFLGQSTIGLYHHFGSLNGFLIQVDGLGWQRLLEELELAVVECKQREPNLNAESALRAVALRYVDFASKYRTLYWLMTEHFFDRAALRRAGRLRLETPLMNGFSELLRACGSAEPATDLVLAFSALHGLVSLVQSGRLDLGDDKHARARVHHTASRLAALLAS